MAMLCQFLLLLNTKGWKYQDLSPTLDNFYAQEGVFLKELPY